MYETFRIESKRKKQASEKVEKFHIKFRRSVNVALLVTMNRVKDMISSLSYLVKAVVLHLHMPESIEVSTITKDWSQNEKTLANLKYCTRFFKQWRSKEEQGVGGHKVLSAGLGGASTHFAVILKHNFKQKYRPKYG